MTQRRSAQRVVHSPASEPHAVHSHMVSGGLDNFYGFFLTIRHVGFAKLNFPPQLTQPTRWKIFVNGQPFTGSVSAPVNTEVPLSSHDIVTLEYGTPDPRPDDASTYQFPANLKQ